MLRKNTKTTFGPFRSLGLEVDSMIITYGGRGSMKTVEMMKKALEYENAQGGEVNDESCRACRTINERS